MRTRTRSLAFPSAAILLTAALQAQPPRGGPQPEFVRQAQQSMREGKLDSALEIYRKELAANPGSPEANRGAGIVLDLAGKGEEARRYFQKAIDAAPDDARKAAARRDMAMSYAFSGDCRNAAKYEQMVFDHWAAAGDFYQQGEIADEAARVCIDAGDLDTAERYYKMGHDAGLKQPDITPGRKDLWEFRWEHAQARLAARRGNQPEAEKHVARARALLDDMAAKDAPLAQQQRGFLPYLAGYVAFYAGDYKTALAELEQANPNDPFYQCLIGMTREKLGDREKALEAWRKAAQTTAHNPPAAFARPFARRKLAEGGAQAFDPSLPSPVPPVSGAVVELAAVRYIDLAPGTGTPAAAGRQYTVSYTGWLRDGTRFDSAAADDPLTFVQGRREVIPGFDVGFQGMQVGGKRRLFIPWQLAYGEQGREKIPPRAELIFDLELLAVKDAPAPPRPPAADLLMPFNELERKALSLAKAVPEAKYDWRPAPGVRSFKEVFLHIALGNRLMLNIADGVAREELMKQIEANSNAERQPVTRQKLVEMLAESFQAVREAIESSRPAALARPIDFFGTPTTRRGVLADIDGHIAEHVGQLIAYARMNGIVPPWSQPK